MTMLVWNRVGERFYQTGIDRGVLYPVGQPGVVWNGLVSVTESTKGGEARAFYVDGYKYQNKPAREELEGTIEAFTYPDEFEVCDGTKAMGRGIFLTHQRRKPFGLSYRTRIGNDVAGDGLGYKIHLIYNALASPAEKTYTSIGDQIDPITFSWSFTTKPIRVAGHHPVPHIIVDSTKTSPSLMAAIEDILYGSESTSARLPPPSEVVTLFAEWPELLVVNNGDGTYTVSGPDDVVALLSNTTFQISSPAAIDNADGTFNVSSL